jgi:hypothetical protein
MKKVITTLVIVAGLFAGSVSFAGIGGPKSGGNRAETPIFSPECVSTAISSVECTTITSLE